MNEGGLDALTCKMVYDIHEKSKLVTSVYSLAFVVSKWKFYAHVYSYVHINIKSGRIQTSYKQVGKLSFHDFTCNLFNISN